MLFRSVLNVDKFGRVIGASNTSISTTVNLSGDSGTGSVAGGGTLTFTGSTGLTTSVSGSTITLTNSGVTSITSNNTGRITQSVTTGAVAFDLATSGVTAGTYSYPSLQVDAYGRVTTISNQTPVTSWNGMTGAVTLSSANVVSALTYTPVNKAGDTMSGALTGVTNLGTNTVSFGNGAISSNTYTTSTTSQVAVDSFATTTYRSAKYLVSVTSGTSYHTIELQLIHDGTSVWMAQYDEIYTGASLGSFDAGITSGNLNLLFTPTNATTTVKVMRYTINV